MYHAYDTPVSLVDSRTPLLTRSQWEHLPYLAAGPGDTRLIASRGRVGLPCGFLEGKPGIFYLPSASVESCVRGCVRELR